MRICTETLIAAACLAAVPAAASARVIGTKHNLAIQRQNAAVPAASREVCAFCHTPHAPRVKKALWNQQMSSAVYKPYESSTLGAKVGQPTGASKLCLSCHDGTIAAGTVLKGRRAGSAKAWTLDRRKVLGTDLSDDHPISFRYDAALFGRDPQLVNPATLPKSVPLDANREMQCTSCHDAHDDKFGSFLVADNGRSALCTACHDMSGWRSSAHANSAARWSGAKDNPWPGSPYRTVAENGCASCHQTHAARHPERLLSRRGHDEVCLGCHAGTVAAANIEAAMSGPSAHRTIEAGDIHDPVEDPVKGMPLHVTCVDCHNPHDGGARSRTASAPHASMRGVSGVDAGGAFVKESRHEHEICYKCHGLDGRQPAKPRVLRIDDERNIRRQFDLSNQSFHPVHGKAPSSRATVLTPSHSSDRVIQCTDCHGNGAAKGPKGPHGSIFAPILRLPYSTADRTVESGSAYALCYECHDRTAVLYGATRFKKHADHVVKHRTPCSACHDAHGSQRNRGLINFDRAIVKPAAGSAAVSFVPAGRTGGRCYLSCHGAVHNPRTY
ncbi:MAG: hypothetical protein HY897_13890 [Deltaproteobacteria bacterium]|nr:hypothetical protein [Deltaproteobacteria bacterium]